MVDREPFNIYRAGLLHSKQGNQEAALQAINTAIKMEPQNPLFYRWAAEVLVKMNEIDQALSILYAYREGPYYAQGIVIDGLGIRSDTRKMIDYAICQIEAKKARGYVYRPKKQT